MEQSTDLTPNLRERLTEVLNTTLVTLEGDIKPATDMPWDRHDHHRFLYNCAVCQGNVPAIVAAVSAVRDEEMEQLRADLEQVTRRANRDSKDLAKVQAERDALRAIWSEWRGRLGGSFPRAMVQEMDAAALDTPSTPERPEAPGKWLEDIEKAGPAIWAAKHQDAPES